YSVRSVVYQASRDQGGCVYHCSQRGSVVGKIHFSDSCHDPQDFWGEESRSCHILQGYKTGGQPCPLFQKLLGYCQTPDERYFLRMYLDLAKDRTLPFPLPQPRIGPAERRRPDFVLIIAIQFWRYRWLAIQLDNGHGEEMADEDDLRDIEISVHGYEVIRLRSDDHGYKKQVKSLIEMVDHEMSLADSDRSSVAVDVPAREYDDDDPPF
ncbi:MAG: hypothetical protein ACE5JQ_05105, partial [Candidatus Methylomirabilales bacterium]